MPRHGRGSARSAVRRAGAAAAACALLAGLAACTAADGSTPVPTPTGPAATELALSGDLRTHDPALVVGEDGEPWYVFSTGDQRVGLGSIQIRTSPDGREWTEAGTVWKASTRPEWVYEQVPGVSNFWAPELVENDGTWYLYYSASTFGSNRSLIGLYTNTTLDPSDPAYAWVDQGEVWRSTPGETDYNAIDAGIVEDADGTPWMAFGSFWGGIQLVELSWPSGKPADPGAEAVTIASRRGQPNAIEAPYLVARDGWFYLFVSRDACCQGTDSTYNMAVGRSREVTGPYVDREGVPLLEDGGTPLLATRGDRVGPGGQSVSAGHLAFHYYDASLGGDFQLAIRELAWDGDGWPVATTAEEQAADAAGTDEG